MLQILLEFVFVNATKNDTCITLGDGSLSVKICKQSTLIFASQWILITTARLWRILVTTDLMCPAWLPAHNLIGKLYHKIRLLTSVGTIRKQGFCKITKIHYMFHFLMGEYFCLKPTHYSFWDSTPFALTASLILRAWESIRNTSVGEASKKTSSTSFESL